MLLLLVSTLAIIASTAAFASWRSNARLRERHAYVETLRDQERFVLDAVRGLTEASRVSSDAVLTRLAQSLREREPAIDAVLGFAPEGEELACVFTEGSRVAHYERLRMRRDAKDVLPALAAFNGHRASGASGLVIPTDRVALAVPMQDRGGLHAVLYVSSGAASRLAEEETIVRTIEHAASPFALALERESDRADATYDGLTGLLTPRAFRERLRDEIARMHLRASPLLSLWFIDTDHFKSVNDTYGHAAGDGVLQSMAKLLRAHTVAEVDAVGRNGGDEFCALIFDAQKTVAIERAQEFCEGVRAHDFGIPLRVTTSVGVASFPYDARDANELLEVADAAMYHSKRSGRNRVSFSVNGTSFSIYR